MIDEATALIKAIDTQTPQVMIEAKIVEANLDFSRELGSVWAVRYAAIHGSVRFGHDPRQDLGSDDFTFTATTALAFANPITSGPDRLATPRVPSLLDDRIERRRPDPGG